MADKPKRKFIDWDSIEPLYRAGAWSNCEITRQYAADHITSQTWRTTVTETAIRAHAKKHMWLRDIADKVQKQVRENLVRTGVRSDGKHLQTLPPRKITDKEIIDKAAEAGSNIIIRHRVEIQNLEKNETILLKELEGHADKFDPLIGPTLKDKSTILKNIAAVRAQRIALERQAHGLDEGGGSNDNPYKEMADSDLAKKVDAYKARLLK